MPSPFPEVTGLTDEQVAEQNAAGHVNVDASVKTRSVGEIVRENVVTLFNFVNVVLFAFVLYTGSIKNGLFMIIIVLNTAIGIVQEIRSKRVTDRLSIVASSDAKAIRNGKRVDIPQDQIVLGDCLVLGRGDQVPCDATVIAGTAKVDESLLTGESNLIPKEAGSGLMSGSFVNSGLVAVRVEHVGADNYAAKITAEAKKRKAINSEIMTSLNRIIRFVSVVIFPVGIALFVSTHVIEGVETNEAILSSVAALVGMVPEGLILLTSTVLALAVIRLSQKNVLVQQLYCIETLAHVDTLCLDKTGTITSGAMEMTDLVALDASGAMNKQAGMNTLADITDALRIVASADPDPNETASAIISWCSDRPHAARKGQASEPTVSSYVPFSSDRKWSGATLSDGSSYVMGAAQFVMGESYPSVESAVNTLAADSRVLVFAQVDGFDGERIVGTPRALALVCIRDQIRSSAAQTIAYFKQQGVDIKVISGDDPKTVANIARKVGVTDADRPVDATTLDTDEKIAAAIGEYHVFGRVKPEQKRAFVKALQEQGHVVAMTGDGVNDTLALKESDCSVAMAAGSDAARNVAQLVLVDNDFASMPEVVAEGRRSINNLQRSASLFLIKTVFSMVLALLFIFLPWQYPYQPIQMTLISMFTIGLPSFVLALEPNHDRIKGKFLENVIVRSLPGSITVIVADIAINLVGYLGLGLSYGQVSTTCVVVTAWIGMNLIFRISRPFTPIRAALLAVVAVGFTLGVTVLPDLFSISPFTSEMLMTAAIAAVASSILFNLVYNAFGRWHERRQAQLV
jgi:cation-transporting ATPase E